MTATDHLARLAQALNVAGWATRLRPEILHVFHPLLPQVGESVRVVCYSGGRAWFVDSYGKRIGLSHNIPAAVTRIGVRLAPLAELAAGGA